MKQVFLYVTNECNLRCRHCLYKPDLAFHLKEKEIDLRTASALLSDFSELGASKLTIMGGEPTLYGRSQHYKPLLTLINEAKKLGYEYVRIDTNGIFENKLLSMNGFKKLDEITFSLDGHSPKMNDPLRGDGTFHKCVSNIERAVELGYNVDITCCLHKELVARGKDGSLPLDSMIYFVSSLGVKRINFHDLFKSGIPRDTWTGNFEPSIQDWMSAYADIKANIASGKYKIPGIKPSISRFCSLSRMLETFFAGYLQMRLESDFKDLYTVFSGGDDFFIVGPWNRAIDIVKETRKKFSKFTGDNPDFTFSAGVFLSKPYEPIFYCADQAKKELKKSKLPELGKDKITLFRHTISWYEMDKILIEAQRIIRWLAKEPQLISRAFAYNLREYGEMAHKSQIFSSTEEIKTEYLKFIPLLTYDISRNLTKEEQKESSSWAQNLIPSENKPLGGDFLPYLSIIMDYVLIYTRG